jgi:redox-sensitive bicupin YhaK (pirin superfamily)
MSHTHIVPTRTNLGDGFFVRRALPQVGCRAVGPFLFWDHMGPAPLKTGFELVVRQHPHIHLATLTYLFSGAILHRDSLGNECLIRPGAVNWMTAGRGIVHSERSQPSPEMVLEGIQLWMGLPRGSEDCEPSFEHHPTDTIPDIEPGIGVKGKLIAGEVWGCRSPVSVYSPLFYADVLVEPGAALPLPPEPTWDIGMYVLNGSVSAQGGQDQPLKTVQEAELLVMPAGSRPTLRAESGSRVRVLLFGGEPFPEKRHMWWNFVSSDKARIEMAKKQWANKEFPLVSDEADFIPLPNDAPASEHE